MSLDYYALQIAAALHDDRVDLQIARDAAGLAVAFDAEAPLLPRVLGAVAAGFVAPEAARDAIQGSEPLRRAAVDLAGAQTGDVTVGDVAGRDVITINVYVGDTRAP